MSVFSVSFRLEYDNNYSARWDSIADKIKAIATNGKSWSEMTAQYVFESTKTADSIANEIAYLTKFDSKRDSLFVLNLSFNLYETRGKFSNLSTLQQIIAKR
ncbi:hypothetical protein [Inquilinus limosus]|uniref:hypothetical protein n=1 Tax=Inquilinus limosus TaxID=171674 RepID=UPI0012DF7343|nr:hypothetical protein [Inquilinus limosus]